MAKIVIEEGYAPSDAEPFMNERQREYFRRKLQGKSRTFCAKPGYPGGVAERERESSRSLTDRASSETDRAIELRARDRQRKLIAKIDAALSRIEDGPTVTARRPASRSRSSAWRPARSRPCRSRPRSATSGASGSTGTIEGGTPVSPPGKREGRGQAVERFSSRTKTERPGRREPVSRPFALRPRLDRPRETRAARREVPGPRRDRGTQGGACPPLRDLLGCRSPRTAPFLRTATVRSSASRSRCNREALSVFVSAHFLRRTGIHFVGKCSRTAARYPGTAGRSGAAGRR